MRSATAPGGELEAAGARDGPVRERAVPATDDGA